MTLKEKLEKVLENKTQKELAKELGVHFSTLKRVRGVVQGEVSESMKKHLEEKINEHLNINNEVNGDIQTKCEVGTKKNTVESEVNGYYQNESDVDYKYVKSLEKKVQKLLDNNRILRKERRNGFRDDNIQETFFEEVESLLKDRMFNFSPLPRYEGRGDCDIVIQLSDLHLGQLVEMQDNYFDMDVARDRLTQYAEALEIKIDHEQPKRAIVAFTGDLFSLDHKLDMLLTSQYTRAENFVRGFDIICEFIERIVATGVPVSLVGVVGNESRVKAHEFHSNVDKVATDNFDYLVFQMIKRSFGDRVKFMNDCNVIEDCILTHGHNIMLIHGDKIKHTNDDVTKLRMRHIENGGDVDHVIMGHIHQFCLTPTWSRSGSLVGANSYSSIGLNIPSSIASQNAYIVRHKGIEAFAIRLD